MSWRSFVLRLIAPRPNFAQTLTESEREIMSRHAAHWRPYLERGDLVIRRAFEIAKRVAALVRFEINRILQPLRDLQAEIVRGEMRGAFQVAGAKPHIRNVLKFDHAALRHFCLRKMRLTGVLLSY